MGTRYEVIDNGRDRARWAALRREGIGSSDAAAVLGINPWSSAMDVYAEKLGLYGEPDQGPPSEYARWGQILEPHVIEEFRSSTGRQVVREGRLLRSRARPFQQTTLDARQRKTGVRSPGSLEVKTTKFDWNDGVPVDIMAQVQHSFAVTGFEWGSIAVWNRTTCEFQWLDVEPEREYIDELNERELDFWSGLAKGEPPEPDDSDQCARALRAIYPKPLEGLVLDLDGEMLDVTDDLELVKQEMGDLKKRRTALENQIKSAIGNAEAGLLPNGVMYTHKLQHRPSTISKESSFRVLRRKEARHG